MNIVICDDEINDIKHIRKSIEEHSDEHKITELLSAKVLLERIYVGEKFDLLFLDVKMPDSDGW